MLHPHCLQVGSGAKSKEDEKKMQKSMGELMELPYAYRAQARVRPEALTAMRAPCPSLLELREKQTQTAWGLSWPPSPCELSLSRAAPQLLSL